MLLNAKKYSTPEPSAKKTSKPGPKIGLLATFKSVHSQALAPSKPSKRLRVKKRLVRASDQRSDSLVSLTDLSLRLATPTSPVGQSFCTSTNRSSGGSLRLKKTLTEKQARQVQKLFDQYVASLVKGIHKQYQPQIERLTQFRKQLSEELRIRQASQQPTVQRRVTKARTLVPSLAVTSLEPRDGFQEEFVSLKEQFSPSWRAALESLPK